jgi:hypothetical protein
MESLPGSSIRKETRWSYGKCLPANDKGCWAQGESAALSGDSWGRKACPGWRPGKRRRSWLF